MFRYVLSFTFSVCLTSAATISTSATCNGVTTFGTFSASCADGRYFAHANLQIIATFSADVDANPNSFPPGSSSASATFTSDD
jgi:hypothetical protein